MEEHMFVPSPALMRPVIAVPQHPGLPQPAEIPYTSVLEIGHWALIVLLTLAIFLATYFYIAMQERNYRGTPLFSFERNSFGSWWVASSAGLFGFISLVFIIAEARLKGIF